MILGECFIRNRNCFHFASTLVPRFYLVGSVLLIVLVICVVLLFVVAVCRVSNVACVYGMSIFDCPFRFYLPSVLVPRFWRKRIAVGTKEYFRNYYQYE